jgi:hypothetical protein
MQARGLRGELAMQRSFNSSVLQRAAGGITLAAISLLASGCTAIQAQSRVDPQTIANYGRSDIGAIECPARLPDDSHGGAINLDCFYFQGDATTKKTAYVHAATDRGSRNRLASILLKHADDVCTLEMGRLVADEATVNTGLSTLTSALAGASTIVTGNLAKSILSGGADLANATRSHVNEHIYRNILSTAIGRAVRNEQERRRKEIEGRFSKELADYSVDAMIVDVNAYHQVCSLERGLGLVLDAVDRTKFEAGEIASGISLNIQLLDNRIAALQTELAHANADEKPMILKELGDYRAQRDALLKKLTGAISEATADGKPGQPAGDEAGQNGTPDKGKPGGTGTPAKGKTGSTGTNGAGTHAQAGRAHTT